MSWRGGLFADMSLGIHYRLDNCGHSHRVKAGIKQILTLVFMIIIALFSRFGGFAYSDSDFRQEYEAFKKKLTDVGAQYSQDKWMHVSYNSPWEMKNRRNEIWIPAL